MVEQPSSSKETERASIELLLPSREKLKPCGPDSAFAEAPFQSGEFAEQKLQTQLLVAKEIIRQARAKAAGIASDSMKSAEKMKEAAIREHSEKLRKEKESRIKEGRKKIEQMKKNASSKGKKAADFVMKKLEEMI